MISEDLCLDCFESFPHEEDDISCSDSFIDSFESGDSLEE
jgi:hypothetical protein